LCERSIHKTITINPLPVANFTHLQACLPFQPVSFTNTSSVANSSTLTYQWNFGDPGSGAQNTSSLQNPSHLYTTAGTYSVNLTVTSSDGCVKDTTISISDIYAQPRGSFTVNPENCLNTPTVFTSTSTVVVQQSQIGIGIMVTVLRLQQRKIHHIHLQLQVQNDQTLDKNNQRM
jgi:PKD repeat protein